MKIRFIFKIGNKQALVPDFWFSAFNINRGWDQQEDCDQEYCWDISGHDGVVYHPTSLKLRGARVSSENICRHEKARVEENSRNQHVPLMQ